MGGAASFRPVRRPSATPENGLYASYAHGDNVSPQGTHLFTMSVANEN